MSHFNSSSNDAFLQTGRLVGKVSKSDTCWPVEYHMYGSVKVGSGNLVGVRC